MYPSAPSDSDEDTIDLLQQSDEFLDSMLYPDHCPSDDDWTPPARPSTPSPESDSLDMVLEESSPVFQSSFGANVSGTNKRQFRSVFMTIFGTEEELVAVPNRLRAWPPVKCFMLANETCTTTERPHVHVLCKFNSRVLGSTIWKTIGRKCDLRSVKTWPAAVNYLKKQDKNPVYYNWESVPVPGKRNDIGSEDIIKRIREGESLPSIMLDHVDTAIKYHAGVKFLCSTYSPLRDRSLKPLVQVFCGKAGTGKSFAAKEILGEGYFQKCPTLKWWDGYTNEKAVLCDEITAGAAPFHELLTYIDYGSPRVEIKGVMHPLVAQNFIFTSNHSPSDWYTNVHGRLDLDALYRRLDIVRVYYASRQYEELHNPDSTDGSKFRRLVEDCWRKHMVPSLCEGPCSSSLLFSTSSST